MALRIAREEIYLPLPIDSEHIEAMQGKREYFVPVAETSIPKNVIDELMEIGNKAIARGLVIQNCDIDDSDTSAENIGLDVIYYVRCGLVMRNGVSYLRMSHIEPLNFGLKWKEGKFYQYENRKEQAMKKPTQKQMAFIANVAQDLLVKHKITTADSSQANPFLLALLIPMSVGVTKVKAFANDLFHSLNVLPENETMNVAEANQYCAIDADEENGCYLVIFNHPAIFDYPENSPEARCAYGVWKSIVG